MEYELAGKDGYKAAGLLDKCHDGNFAVGISICDEQTAVGDDEKYCKQPDPVVFKGGLEIEYRGFLYTLCGYMIYF